MTDIGTGRTSSRRALADYLDRLLKVERDPATVEQIKMMQNDLMSVADEEVVEFLGRPKASL